MTGLESFRIRQNPWSENHTSATTQLGYNDAIAMDNESIYFGVGQSLQKLVPFRSRLYRL